jgi:hypothetical protein
MQETSSLTWHRYLRKVQWQALDLVVLSAMGRSQRIAMDVVSHFQLDMECHVRTYQRNVSTTAGRTDL